MEIGDLLYIAFALLSVFFGVFGKKKKKPNQKSNSGFNLNDFIQDTYSNEFEETSVTDVEEPIVKNDPPKPSSQDTSLSQKLAKRKADAKAKMEKVRKQSRNSPIFENEISDTVPSSEFEFDAEKAVIYNEILKRPEY